jgi:signal peptidase II
MSTHANEKIGQGWSLAQLYLLAAFIVLSDQLTKFLCVSNLDYAVPHPVFPGFDLQLVHNFGAAFSFLGDAGGWQRWVLTGISAVASLFIGGWLYRLPRAQWLLGLALACILGGAVGNLYDRWTLGYVIDFISIYHGEWRFATFNVADAAISIGAFLLAFDILRGEPVRG